MLPRLPLRKVFLLLRRQTQTKSYAAPPKNGESPRKSKAAGKVPNFNSFRKKLIFIIAGVILLIGFLVWAIFFAPRATVEITAKTSKENISTSVTLGQTLTTDATKGTLKAVQVEESQEAAVDFRQPARRSKARLRAAR